MASGGLWRLLALGLLAYAAFLVLLAVFQSRLLYFPSKSSEAVMVSSAAHRGLVPWRDGAGRIIGWKSASRAGSASANRMLVFHGNAGSAIDRTYFAEGFQSLDRGELWEVFLFEYPGYGARLGTPGEGAFAREAAAALARLREEDARPVVLTGESIGAAVACDVASMFPDAVAGLLLVTPFPTLAEVASRHYPLVPVRLLLRDRYDAMSSLRRYRGPIAFLAAGRDEIVPMRLVRKLHDGYSGPKRLWIQEEASHNSLLYEPEALWWREVSDFLLR